MNIMSMNCVNCGAPIQVPPDIDQFACAHCGTSLVVERGDGYVALKIAEQLSKVISDSEQKTRAAISEGTHVTQAELKRLQITQDLSAAQMQLSNVQAEIRSLERQKKNGTIKKQLKQLRREEVQLQNRVNVLRLGVARGGSQSQTDSFAKRGEAEKLSLSIEQLKSFSQNPFGKVILSGCLTYLGVAFACTLVAMPLDIIFFKWNPEGEIGVYGPVTYIGGLFAFIFGVVAFFYRWKTGVSIWVPIKARLRSKRNEVKDANAHKASVGEHVKNQAGSLD